MSKLKTQELFKQRTLKIVNCCGRQEEPRILISRLLLRMRRMYVASILWTSTKNEWNAQNAI